MKVLFKNGKYEKISDDLLADQKVRLYGWRYVSRKEYKTNVRDVKKQSVESPDEQTSKHLKTKEHRTKNHSRIKQNQR